jgi:hypothetical protein
MKPTLQAEMLALALKCEQTTGPDRELDLAIGLTALGWEWADNPFDDNPILDIGAPNQIGWKAGNPPPECVPSPTSSLDAAQTVLPEGWERFLCGWTRTTKRGLFGWAEVRCETLPRRCIDTDVVSSDAATPALALCAAALRARASDTPKDREAGR